MIWICYIQGCKSAILEQLLILYLIKLDKDSPGSILIIILIKSFDIFLLAILILLNSLLNILLNEFPVFTSQTYWVKILIRKIKIGKVS